MSQQSQEFADDVQRVESKDASPVDAVQQQTASFVDHNKGDVVQYRAPEHKFISNDAQRETDLGKFLSRPTLIQSLTWGSGGLSATEFYPWEDFLGNTYIEKKIENFAFFRGTLHLKFVLNANPFVYGACLASYVPVQNHVTLGDATHNVINRSQKPHIWMYPQTNTGGEMVLPFIYHQNFMNLETKADLQELGEITLTEVVALDTANDVAIPTITIQVYAWLENTELTGPSTIDNLQGGDEYEKGPVERMSSAVATAAGALSVIPEIAPFTIATAIGASAISGIASIFGWTKVPVIENVKPVRNTQFGGLPSSEISDNKEKFTLDPKAELSIDPGIVNLSNTDELQISYLVQKESYLTTTNWVGSDTVGTQLFLAQVTPRMTNYSASGSNFQVYFTITSYISELFSHWRGDMIYRFKIVSSAYHRGRVRLTWEPRGTQTGSTDYSNVAYTKIVDISEINDFEFRVPYLQPKPWLRVKKTIDKWWTNSTSSTTYQDGYSNGTLRMQVLTTLSSPQASPICNIMVFVRGSETLEFANPRDVNENFTHLELQSGDLQVGKCIPERYLVNFGENINNLRTLLRRAQLSEILYAPAEAASSNTTGMLYMNTGRFPRPRGYDTDAYFESESVVTPTTNEKFSFTNTTHLNWIASMFALNRGSIQQTFNYVATDESPDHFCIVRSPEQTRSANSLENHFQHEDFQIRGGAAQTNEQRDFASKRWLAGAGGAALTNCHNQSSLTVEMPMMTGAVCMYNNQADWLIGNSEDESHINTYTLTVVRDDQYDQFGAVARYVNIGTDFNLHFFLGCPEVYYTPDLAQEKYEA